MEGAVLTSGSPVSALFSGNRLRDGGRVRFNGVEGAEGSRDRAIEEC